MGTTLHAGTGREPHRTARRPEGALFADRYQLRATAKTGNGIDTVFAWDVTDGTEVVLKIIDPALVRPAVRMRFQHETEVLRNLSGLGICSLHDAGASGDVLFLAQPFVPGHTLERALRDGPLSVDDAIRIGIDVAAALDAAHSAGVCHRDVKPANIIVTGEDTITKVTLVDFGFSRSPWLDESIRD